MIAESIESAQQRYDLSLRVPPAFAILNRADLLDHAAQVRGGEHGVSEPGTGAAAWLTRPVPQLLIDDPAFAPNYFHEGQIYVSRAFREAAGLPAAAVAFGPVDTSRCSNLAKSRDYRTLDVLSSSDPVDQVRSDGEWVPWIDDHGEIAQRWELSGGPLRPSPRVAFRLDFVPPAPIFHTDQLGLLVSDDVADRMMRAGLDDVVFVQVEGERGRTEIIYRRL